MSEIELKPCPCCGGKVELEIYDHEDYAICCRNDDCRLEFTSGRPVEVLISKFNTRKPYNESVKVDLISRSVLIESLNQHNWKDVADVIINQPTVSNDGWIPCSERLPEKNGEYLVQNIHGVICVAHYNYNSPCTYRAFFVGYTQVKNIVAWMPLPKPYKESEV